MGGGGVLYIKLPQDPLRSFYISLPCPVVPLFITCFVIASTHTWVGQFIR